MSQMPSLLHEPVAPVVEQSPLSLTALGDLFLRPGTFFGRGTSRLKARGALVLVVLIGGITAAWDRIETRASLESLQGNEGFYTTISSSWGAMWGMVLVAGAIGSVFAYLILGWWYRKRLEWSAAAHVDPDDARAVWAWQNFVNAAPALLLAIVATATAPSLMETSPVLDTAALLVLALAYVWSVTVSYTAVTTLWALDIWKARIWFVILPILLFGMTLVGVVAAVFLMAEG